MIQISKTLGIVGLLYSSFAFSQIEKSRLVTLMGSKFEITVVEQDSTKAEHQIDQAITEIDRIENLISEWRKETPISKVNQNAGISPVKVDSEIIQLTETALYFSKLTRGAFDISIVAMDIIWKFDDSMTELPSPQALRNSVRNVNYRDIIIDKQKSTLFLKNKGMKIGFGSIGKAYAAEKAKEILIRNGVTAGIINAAGDVATWGKQPNGEPWRIGIQNPFQPDGIEAVLEMDNNAIVTSGSYEKFAEINGKRYSHIINPKTGIPSTGIISVSVWGQDATFANGLSTSVMVLDLKKGIQLLQKFKKYQYLIITDDGKILSSNNP